MAAGDGDDEEREILAKLVDWGRFTVTTVLVALAALITVAAIAFLLRPEELRLSVVHGSVSVDKILSRRPPNVTFRVTILAYNPSARFTGIRCTNGTIHVLQIKPGRSVPIASFKLDPFFVAQRTTRVARTVDTVNASKIPAPHLSLLYHGGAIGDAALVVETTFSVTKSRGEPSRWGRHNVLYSCWPVAVGYMPSQDDTACTRTPAGFGQIPQQIPNGDRGGGSPQVASSPSTSPGADT